MDETTHTERDLGLLEEIARDPETSQVTMATRMGIAVGTVNWHLKRLVAKGYVKVKRLERRKLRYIITPEGIALRARLTMKYIENSMTLYREVREDSKSILEEVQRQGLSSVYIDGEGDIADVCRLSCLEGGFEVLDSPSQDGAAAVLKVQGMEIHLELPGDRQGVGA
jgi:DNA-binding MarR family transcriptional regulator